MSDNYEANTNEVFQIYLDDLYKSYKTYSKEDQEYHKLLKADAPNFKRLKNIKERLKKMVRHLNNDHNILVSINQIRRYNENAKKQKNSSVHCEEIVNL